jgi:transposase
MAGFTRAVSLSFNVLAPVEGVDGKRRVPASVESAARPVGSPAGDRLGAGDWRRHVLPGKKRGAAVGYGKQGKGTKIMLLTDGEGTPLAATLAGADRAEVNRIEPLVDSRVCRRKPKRLIYDRAGDSDPLRKRLKTQRIELISPHRKNRKRPPTQDGRALRRYKRRYRIERSISWLTSLRRIATRYERYPHLFLAFVQLGCLYTVLKGL